jgi:hypothetical protein
MSNPEHKEKIVGKWEGEVSEIDANGKVCSYKIVMEVASASSEESCYHYTGNGHVDHPEYDRIPMFFHGNFRKDSEYIQFDYENEDPGTIHFGACILVLSPYGDALEGNFVGRSPVDIDMISGLVSLAKT